LSKRRNPAVSHISVTRALVYGGAADYAFVDDEARWRGSEVARATELLDKGTLVRTSVPASLRGYLRAYERFKAECHFVPDPDGIECSVEGIIEGEVLRGRADRFGYLRGKRAIGDLKTGAILPATRLQTVLYGHLKDPTVWWPRFAVRLDEDGTYRYHTWEVTSWVPDLNTAKAFVRVARWRILNKVVRL